MQAALSRAEEEAPDLVSRLHDTRTTLLELREEMEGSEAKNQIGERNPPTPASRLDVGNRALDTTYGPTEMHKETLETGRRELADIRQRLDKMTESVIPDLEQALTAAGAPPVEGQAD